MSYFIIILVCINAGVEEDFSSLVKDSKTFNNNDDKHSGIEQLRDYKVVKSNDLVKARFSLSVPEQKIVLYMISKIKPDDKEFDPLQFSISEFCSICGIDRKSGMNHKNVRDAIKKLADKSAWISVDDREILVRWISKAKIEKSGTIELRLDEDMKPFLLQLKKKFTQYELLYTLAMKSRYSIRIYEILKSYEFQKEKVFDIADLKKSLDAENYSRFPDFQRRVLDIAMGEINDLSDIRVAYTIIKKSRKYAGIKFSITVKEDLEERLQTYANIEAVINPPGYVTMYEKVYGEAPEPYQKMKERHEQAE